MYSQMMESKKTKLTWFDEKWKTLVPKWMKPILPKWQISVGLITLMGFISESQTYVELVGLFWASLTFAFIFRELKKYLGNQGWLIYAFHLILSISVSKPALAQATGGACTNSGLFGDVTNFISSLFSTISFGGTSTTTLSTLLCQVVGFLALALVLGFVGSIGYVAYQVGFQRQPISTTLEPLMGFLIFAGGSSVIISVIV
ncbi:hypothetical protein cce_5028 [Crocosphaera subtropica ATCC 51142]|uniref:Uncharacterized protein n=1 Tax=Crocosphaera subtropica (strain ATCC 51142 / BH68) TaxID=43989 RepID=B1X2L3_CROS5|nr:hypothetical protein [Crocosphaera subtropica]ACB54374.1 hypothetical protein cce_5028 [Crocosphaera subtropica ATCC 51142]